MDACASSIHTCICGIRSPWSTPGSRGRTTPGSPRPSWSVRGWAPQAWVDAFAGLSFLTHFQAISRGVLDLRDVVFFLLCIAAWLAATVLVIDLKKAD